MTAAALAAISALQVVFFGKYNISLWGFIKIFWV
jgi:hypothetical protein